MNKFIFVFLALAIFNVVSAQFGEGEGEGRLPSTTVGPRCNPRCRNGGQCVSNAATPPVFSCQCNLGFSGTSCTTLINFCTTSTAAGAADGTGVCGATTTSLTTCIPITARNALGVLPGYVCVPAGINPATSKCLSSGKQVDGSNLVQLQCSARPLAG